MSYSINQMGRGNILEIMDYVQPLNPVMYLVHGLVMTSREILLLMVLVIPTTASL